MADEKIQVVEPVKENPPPAVPAPVVEAPKTDVLTATAPPAPPVAPVIKENPAPVATPAPVTVPVVAPAALVATPVVVPLAENPKLGVDTVFDTKLVKGAGKLELLDIAGAVTGWYVSGAIGYQIYKLIKPAGPQFQYRNVVDHVVRILAEPIGGIVFGSIAQAIGGALGSPQAKRFGQDIVMGSFIRGGVDAVDTAIGFARGNIVEPSGDMLSNFIGMGNILDLSGLKTSADIHDSHLEPTSGISGADGGESLTSPQEFMAGTESYSGAQEASVAGAGSLVDWNTL